VRAIGTNFFRVVTRKSSKHDLGSVNWLMSARRLSVLYQVVIHGGRRISTPPEDGQFCVIFRQNATEMLSAAVKSLLQLTSAHTILTPTRLRDSCEIVSARRVAVVTPA